MPVATSSAPASGAGWGIRDSRGFSALCAIGMVDNATRTGFLTFMPFMLMSKDLTVGGVGLAFSLVFIGGAAGKFVCGLVADRVGVIRTVVLTEAATTLLILVVVAAPLSLALGVLIPLGIALNGTSSVLYGTVADLVSSERRSRGYGLYYTMTIGASALAPDDLGRGRRHRRRSDHPHAGRPRRPGHDPPLPTASPRRHRSPPAPSRRLRREE